MRDSGLASGLLTAFNHETKAWTGLSFISTSAIRAAMSWGSSVAGVSLSAKEITSTPTDFQYLKKDEFGGRIPIRKSTMENDLRPGPTDRR